MSNAGFRDRSSNLRHRTRLACGLIPVLNMLREHDIDIEQALRTAGIRRFELLDPAFTVSFEQELAIVEYALDRLNAPHIGLQLARRYHLHNFSVLGLALRACATVGEAFDLTARYPRLVWGVCEWSAHREGPSIVFQLSGGEGRVEHTLLERDMACIKTLFGEALDSELQVTDVAFSHPAAGDASVYEAFFDCPVRFEQSASRLTLPASELDRPVPTADPLSREFYEAQCARVSAEMDEPFRYAYLIRDQLSHMTPVPDLDGIAAKLGIEPRTLQRLLKRENTTFSEILREVRYKRAGDRLNYSHLSIEEIAEELGFNDAVAFSHAFKQWTGLSPRQWRAESGNK